MYLQVRKGHKIYLERHGNLSAPTILFLHGGPGLGFSDKDLTFFDLERCNVIFFDQRGAGRSLPRGSLVDNTTQDLIQDIEEIRLHFKLNRFFIFGGSWGSMLGLLYTIYFPNKVKALVLRGLFTGTTAERVYFEQGGISDKYPEVWMQLRSLFHMGIPDSQLFENIHRCILGDDKDLAKRCARELMYYGRAVNQGQILSDQQKLDFEESDYLTFSRIMAHYSLNDFFLPDEFINMRIKQIGTIPIHLVHGNQDHITRPIFAKRFCEASPNFHLFPTEGNHSPFDPPNSNCLKELILNIL